MGMHALRGRMYLFDKSCLMIGMVGWLGWTSAACLSAASTSFTFATVAFLHHSPTSTRSSEGRFPMRKQPKSKSPLAKSHARKLNARYRTLGIAPFGNIDGTVTKLANAHSFTHWNASALTTNLSTVRSSMGPVALRTSERRAGSVPRI